MIVDVESKNLPARICQMSVRLIAEACRAVLIDQFPDLADVILPSSASVE